MVEISGKLHKEIYDDIFHRLWELSMGQGGKWRTQYKGARRMALFILQELEYIDSLEAAGETAIERRGLAAPRSVMVAWTYNILDDCFSSRIPPPWELVSLIYTFMGCRHFESKKNKSHLKDELHKYEKLGIRKASRQLGVNPTTVMQWRTEHKERDEKWWPEIEIIEERMGLNFFYPMKHRKL